MQPFENILVIMNPLENFASALKRAVELAALQNARLTVFDINQEFPRELSQPGLKSEEIIQEYQEKRRAQIETLLAGVDCPATPEIKILMGVSFTETIGQVLRGKHDLLIKPSGPNGNGVTSLNSTDINLLRNCPVPVWIVKPTGSKKYRRIMAALDPKSTEASAELNSKILDIATSLAASEQAELHAVSVWNLKCETELRSRAWRGDQLLDDLEKAYKKWLTQITRPYGRHGEKIHAHLIKGRGKVYDVISDEAKKHNADVIVMGSLSRTGIPGFFKGNTAERVLSRIKCSILTVKPDGLGSLAEA
jgi:nucleotide-binding universal stress UspA family protein